MLNNEILMVVQEKPNEPELWSVPSGEVEEKEIFEGCFIREVWEETDYQGVPSNAHQAKLKSYP
ncbi:MULTISPECIES: NUDIX domain-containing protein [Bacillus]|uniref:NUDIX domain-containing protein n=1 Tax=Bacillus TaxID=1386 RepID=UPI00351C42D1